MVVLSDLVTAVAFAFLNVLETELWPILTLQSLIHFSRPCHRRIKDRSVKGTFSNFASACEAPRVGVLAVFFIVFDVVVLGQGWSFVVTELLT